MKQLLTCLVFAFITIQVYAVPAKPELRTLMLADGTPVSVKLVGDEHTHWYVDARGSSYRMLANERLEPLSSAEMQTIRTNGKLRNQKSTLRRASRLASQSRSIIGRPTKIVGERRGLVILVQFPDLAMQATSTRTEFDNMFNQSGYSNYNHIGSVSEYYKAQSFGKFNITFDVVGPVTVSHSYSYYGANDANGDDIRPATMVAEACRLIDGQVDFSKYDWDHDGEVDQVFCIYAGNGEHAGATSDHLWAHEWTLSDGKYYGDGNGPIYLDYVRIDTYAIGSERRGARNTKLAGIGTACHEFSHCLGFPDMYDTDMSSSEHMEFWDVMASGSYNGPDGAGEVPSGFTAYERWFAGWMELTELRTPCFIADMPALNDEPVAYLVRNDNHSYEYFILENRQSRDWFSYAYTTNKSHGMLIYHVDYDLDAWVNNKVNADDNHKRMAFIPADKSHSSGATAYAGDLFPGYKNVTELTDFSHENYGARLFHPNTDHSYYMRKPITDIKEENGLISFSFMGGIPSAIAPHFVDSSLSAAAVYTLQGTLVGTDTGALPSGIYIRNGKKILIR